VKIAITGTHGQLGFELLSALSALGECVPLDRNTLDLAQVHAIAPVMSRIRPDIIVNAAAYTAVDAAESDAQLAARVNGEAPGALADWARGAGALLVHFSTDYVFDGGKPTPYVESDAVAPLNVYGASKLAGEQAISASRAHHLILRTSWVYGLRGRNFLNTIWRLAREKPELRVVDDQFGAPTWSRWLAGTTAAILGAWQEAVGRESRLPLQWDGVYHCTAGGKTTWHGFASAIVAELSARGFAPRVPVLPIPGSALPLPAARPCNSVLSNEKLARVFGIGQIDWRDQLAECLDGLGGGAGLPQTAG
jgi:dTDP-4-dehydrorhamnose reductase